MVKQVLWCCLLIPLAIIRAVASASVTTPTPSSASGPCSSTTPSPPDYVQVLSIAAADKAKITSCFTAKSTTVNNEGVAVPLLIFPGDTNYDLRRRGDNAYTTWFWPRVIVMVTDEKHIQVGVQCAAALGLEVNAFAGGHDYEGGFANTGILMHMLNYKNVASYDVDPANPPNRDFDETPATMEFQVGVLNAQARGEMIVILQKYGLQDSFIFSSGTIDVVGLGGHTLCGGYGNFGRYLGMAADQVASFRVVNALGDVMVANPTQNADLWWALRGSCTSAFGIVSTITFNLKYHPSKLLTSIYIHGFTSATFPIGYQWMNNHGALVPDKWSIIMTADKGSMGGWYAGPLAEAYSVLGYFLPGTKTKNPNSPLVQLEVQLGSTWGFAEKSPSVGILGELGYATPQAAIAVLAKPYTTGFFLASSSSIVTTNMPLAPIQSVFSQFLGGSLFSFHYKARYERIGRNATASGSDWNPPLSHYPAYNEPNSPILRGWVGNFILFHHQPAFEDPVCIDSLNELTQSLSQWSDPDAGYAGYQYFDGIPQHTPQGLKFFGATNTRIMQDLRQCLDPENVFTSRKASIVIPVPFDKANVTSGLFTPAGCTVPSFPDNVVSTWTYQPTFPTGPLIPGTQTPYNPGGTKCFIGSRTVFPTASTTSTPITTTSIASAGGGSTSASTTPTSVSPSSTTTSSGNPVTTSSRVIPCVAPAIPSDTNQCVCPSGYKSSTDSVGKVVCQGIGDAHTSVPGDVKAVTAANVAMSKNIPLLGGAALTVLIAYLVAGRLWNGV